jgi:hypothetical protein
MRLCIVCPKHDGVFPRVVLSPVTVVVPKPLGTEIWDDTGEVIKASLAARDEGLREEGRREVKAKVRALLFRNDGDLEADLRELVGEDEPS